ncbi:ATP-dependent DNA/RNA helicase DHX36 [Bradysia coprophila]|uniref:ATP-dependent DNA/RNA helicase DHX36 n=1 Tax=Bradysia coprophila TaxID=38358 RepID=UPI00187D71C3|nr:ATP-dependent DNA/RNA helicase DHX36 [Bradysia coprophila]
MSKSFKYRQVASRLRNELQNRKSASSSNAAENVADDVRPPGLRGREIGLWYAKRNKMLKEHELKGERQHDMLSGPKISLPEKVVDRMKKEIDDVQADIAKDSSSQTVQTDFSRYRETDFMKLIQTDEEPQSSQQSSDLDTRLCEEFNVTTKTEKYEEMFQFRQRLPSFQHKDEIVDAVKRNQVLLVAGNTGCGKTTQVAQYILDDALMNMEGSKTKILCTQPRRIAATSIAERVASERGEELGHSIGYQIRLEKTPPRSIASILFCTTGVLLKFMEQSPNLSEYSHIIIDEIHERNAITDVCLALIKKITEHRKSLKVILMSATLNEERFAEYFNDCPIIRIAGLTYPVQDFFLEDILEETGFDNFTKRRKEPVWWKYKKPVQEATPIIQSYANSLRQKYSQKTIDLLKRPETENIDLAFIQHIIMHISNTKPSGAILVFLPGFSVISKLYDNLQKDFPPSSYRIYPLHSLLTGSDQREIFNKPPEGVRKIIISTPLAETSITIEDVVYVVNAGKMRRPYFDFERNAKVFEDEWITQANEIQRKGRAGRTQPGICYHLYTRARSRHLKPFEKPEILRVRLEENILTLKVLCIQNVKWFASTMIDVPKESVIESSISCLQRLGALTENEELTPLGLHLANLGVHPKIGKMLLLGSIFSCFGPISSISAGLSFKSPFFTLMGKEKLCDEAKRKFSSDSDQLAVANAMAEWKMSSRNRKDFCYTNFLSNSTMGMLDRMRSQFAQLLHHSRFLSNAQCDSQENNRNSENVDLLKAVIAGGVYPNIAHRVVKIRSRKDCIRTVERKGLRLLPSSVNNDPKAHYDPGFIVFDEMNKYTTNYFLTETTSNVSPFGIILFGDKINVGVKDNINFISVGDMIEFRCDRSTADMIVALRDEFNCLLNKKILESSSILWDSSEGKLLQIIMDLISTHNSYENHEFDETSDNDDTTGDCTEKT